MNGLIYIPFFVSQVESEQLISQIDGSLWLTDLKRRTQHYGYKYDYTKKKIDSSMFLGPLPEWTEDVNKKVGKYFGRRIIPDQIIVNEYTPGQGIAAHVDCESCFGPVVASLSLLSSVKMNFKYGSESESMLLEPRSLLILMGDARDKWTHSIDRTYVDLVNQTPVERKRRVSLTFRTILEDTSLISEDDRKQAYQQGYSKGFSNGCSQVFKNENDSPFKGGSVLDKEWEHGYNTGYYHGDSDGMDDGG